MRTPEKSDNEAIADKTPDCPMMPAHSRPRAANQPTNGKDATMKTNNIAITLIMALLLLSPVLFTACDSQGPAEKTGGKIDDAVESAKEAAEEAGDKITGKGTAAKIGEKIDDTVEDMKKKVSSSGSSSD